MNGREMKKGDSFAVVNSVDLAVTLFTLGVPFYDPARPFTYQVIGGRRSVRFMCELESQLEGVDNTAELMKLWPTAEEVPTIEPPSLVSVCKRTIWERRYCLCEINHDLDRRMQTLANGVDITYNLKAAVIAYALGFGRPGLWFGLVEGGERAYAIGKAPAWVKEVLPGGIDQLESLIAHEIDFIEAPENALNPLATAMAVYINITAWLDHLRTAKPYLHFSTATGKSYWVKEGSEKWRELLSLGYTPH